MTGFADLVTEASANKGGRLANVNLAGTEGRTWKWVFPDITDNAGTAIDLTSATAVCKIISAIDGSDVLALTFTGGSGTFTISATSAATAGLAVGATAHNPRVLPWYLKVTSGGNVVAFWGPAGSEFAIWPE